MGMKDKLQEDLLQALRDGDDLRKRTLRMLQAGIINEEKAGKTQRELTEEEVLVVINRQAKQRRESARPWECSRCHYRRRSPVCPTPK